MTGEQFQPEEIRERLSQLIRYEMRSIPTASFGRIKTLDEQTRRATVELAPDGTTETNIPVATPFATDGSGDISPLNPEVHDTPVRGILLYFHHPVSTFLSEGGEYDSVREHEEENAVFLPAQVWSDSETVPAHMSDERRFEHHSGNRIQMTDEHTAIEHALGAMVEALGRPEPELEGDSIMDDVPVPPEAQDPDVSREQWPVAEGETASRLRHPDGNSVTTTRRGVAIESDRVDAGSFTDGERVPLAGPHQHFHLVDHGHDEYSLAGPQLSFREFIAWMTDSTRQSQLRNSGQYDGARQYAQAYLSWLEDYLGRPVDPTNPDDWPDPEPMPHPDEHDSLIEGNGD